jgi:serine/threonine protein kinase
MTSMIGTVLGGYELKQKLGEGAAGETYLAVHLESGQRAAVEVLGATFSSHRELLNRFFAEVRAVSKVNHEGIADLYDTGVDKNGRAYLVMEFLEGRTLTDSLIELGSIRDVERLADIGWQLSTLLSAVHAAKLLHGALNPDGIFLTFPKSWAPRPLVKLLDFGMTMFSLDAHRSQTGSLLGALLYMAPEIARGPGRPDHRSDIYSLGCIFFEMACGRPPFVREGKGELIVAHATEMPPPASSLEPSIPPILDKLIGRMLTKNPAARPQSMAEVASVLEKLFKCPDPASRAADPTPPAPVFPTAVLPPAPGLHPSTPPFQVPPTVLLPDPGPASSAIAGEHHDSTALLPSVETENQAAGGLVGAVLEGVYRMDRLLGEGGMGAVYQATHLRLGKQVGIKIMARALAENHEALKRFHREAVVTSSLGHPHIVQVFDFSTMPTGEPFLVMEYLEGEDLSHRLRRDGRLPLAKVIHIVKQIASALSATHAKDIVHRDLKPANVYLLNAAGEKDFVKVLDFGISKVRTTTTQLTQAAAVMGTPQYMSPEQALGKVDQIDARCDQWALACIAWECLSGQSPFTGDSVPSVLFQVVHESPAPLVPKVSDLSPNVEQVLRRALSKNKLERFPDIDQFAESLQQAAEGGFIPVAQLPVGKTVQLTDEQTGDGRLASPPAPSTLRQAAGEVRSEGPTSALQPRRKRLWLLGGILLPAIAVLAVVLLWKRPSPIPAAAPDAKAMLASVGVNILPSNEDEGIAIQATDLQAVDPADLIRQSRLETSRRGAKCGLSHAKFFDLRTGLVDTTGNSARLSIMYECTRADESKPAGEDIVETRYTVSSRQGKLFYRASGGSGKDVDRPDPRCSLAQAWTAAVASGVPSSAIASADYRESYGFAGKWHRLVWAINVAGHDEFARQIDAVTCKILQK